MLNKPCPYHKAPVAHTLEQCEMLKKYYNRAAAKDDNAKKDAGGKDGNGFPVVENVFFIFGGPTTNMTPRQCKREWREVFSVQRSALTYLDWSKELIVFNRDDHPNHIPNPGHYPLVVDPIIANTHFSKVLMDGGNSLNILYAPTLELLGISLDKLRPSKAPFHGVAPGKRVQPLGQIDMLKKPCPYH
ncbi:unnamed protein product [Urochloa humidicola]